MTVTPVTSAFAEMGRQRMLERIDMTASDQEPGFPHIGENDGSWTRSPAGDWTGGFWIGEMWLATRFADRNQALAAHWARRLAPRATSDTIFRSFLFYYGAVLGDLLCGDAVAREVAITGAQALAGDVHPASGVIALGAEAEEASDVGVAETSIDAVGAVAGLLGWAAAITGDEQLQQVAVSHVRWNVENLVRPDGSVVQSATFNPRSGFVQRTYTHKGVGPDSTWARAQAWGLLATIQAARWLPGIRPQTLTQARRIADWWLAHVPRSGVPYWDFDVPADGTHELDTSAAAIAGACLLKLAALEDDPSRGLRYRNAAVDTVRTLVGEHLTPVSDRDPRPAGMLVDACYNRRIGLAVSNELIWGDYFLFEALHVLTGHLDPLAV